MSEDTVKILIVEDERHLATGLKLNFELEGFSVDIAGTVREAAARLASSEPYAAIVLDVSLPDGDGFTLCRKMRSAGNLTPIIMLTARSEATARVEGLEAGADDYLTKPFDLDELLARVNSMLRRQQWEEQRGTPIVGTILEFGSARIDFDTHRAWTGDNEVRLTALEVELMRYFWQNAERVLSREELLNQVWNLRNYPNTRTVDNFVLRLRKHFEPNPKEPAFIVSVRGAGYKFLPQGR